MFLATAVQCDSVWKLNLEFYIWCTLKDIKYRLPLTHLRKTASLVPHLPWFVSFSVTSSSTYCLSRSYSLVSISVYSVVPLFLCLEFFVCCN